MTQKYQISGLGALGDGIADTTDGQIHVPLALPGETVEKSDQAKRYGVTAQSPRSAIRAEPVCRHFGQCGGCAVQHIKPEPYLEWKRDKVKSALAARGIGFEPSAIVSTDPGTRRRAVFSARMTDAGPLVGFMQARSNSITALEECPVIAVEISGSLEMLRSLVKVVGRTPNPFHIDVTDTLNGLDIAVSGIGELPDAKRRQLSDFAVANAICRLSAAGEILVCPRDPVILFDGMVVVPPPGAFLQASIEAENAMAALVGSHLAKAKKIIDLFSGCGTFALRLARHASVHAVESDPAALAALDKAFRFGKGLRTVTVEKRDLYRRPVTARELGQYDGLVFDPPRAGAEEQARQIAKCGIPRVAAVSCNPGTLARDLKILIDGGYVLEAAIPIDQFLWSPHVEVVALLNKPRKRPHR